MVNKRISALMLVLYICVWLSSCEKAPDNNRIDLEDNYNILTAEKFVNIEEANNQIEELRGNSALGFKFSEEFKTIGSEQLYVLELDDCHNDINNIEGIMNLCPKLQLLNEENSETRYDTQELQKEYSWQKNSDKIEYVTVKSDKEDLFYNMSSNGFFSIDVGSSLNNTIFDKNYDLIWGKESLDKETSEIIEKVEAIVNNNLQTIVGDDFDYKIQLVSIYEDESGQKEYTFEFSRIIEGMLLDISGTFYNNIEKQYDENISGIDFGLKYNEADGITFMSMYYPSFKTVDKEAYNQIISPKYAIKLMNEQIAHKENIGFTRCGLVYYITQDAREYKDPETSEMICSENVGIPYYDTYIRPFWIFAEEAKTVGIQTESDSTYGYGETILVDAIDGNVFFFDTSTLLEY